MGEPLSKSDRDHLATLRKGPFYPIGWLYRGVYENLASRGFCREGVNGFYLTSYGLESLEKEEVRRG